MLTTYYLPVNLNTKRAHLRYSLLGLRPRKKHQLTTLHFKTGRQGGSLSENGHECGIKKPLVIRLTLSTIRCTPTRPIHTRSSTNPSLPPLNSASGSGIIILPTPLAALGGLPKRFHHRSSLLPPFQKLGARLWKWSECMNSPCGQTRQTFGILTRKTRRNPNAKDTCSDPSPHIYI